MADTISSTDSFSVFNQTFVLLGPDGITQYPLTVDMVDVIYHTALATQANYGSQIGATAIMLLVCFIMTPQSKFARIPTLINMVALAFNLIRVVMLVWYPASAWFEFYVIMTGDISTIARSNYNTSAAATFFTIPVTILMLSALAIQAWTMVQLWPKAMKVGAMGVSAMVIMTAVGFKIADSIYQALWILKQVDAPRWVRKVDLACSAASICYFCFLFNIRLLIHMWKNHSILPSVKGLSAMEVLVMTNGILMIIPTIFCILEFPALFTDFEFGSLTYTSVVIVLPLGTLAAQRIANPSSFAGSAHGSRSQPPGSGNSYEPALKSWHSSTEGSSGISSTVTSDGRLDRERQSSLQDGGYAKYGCADLEKGVRVDRKIEHREDTCH